MKVENMEIRAFSFEEVLRILLQSIFWLARRTSSARRSRSFSSISTVCKSMYIPCWETLRPITILDAKNPMPISRYIMIVTKSPTRWSYAQLPISSLRLSNGKRNGFRRGRCGGRGAVSDVVFVAFLSDCPVFILYGFVLSPQI